MTHTVLHLVPYDTLGGVETALRSVPSEWDGPQGRVRLRRGYLATHSPVEVFTEDWHGPAISVNHPAAHWQLLRFALRARAEVVIASLWRSCPTFIALKILRPKTKTVLFLHSAVDVHVFDKVFNRLAMRLSDEIWADSNTTLKARVPKRLRRRAKVLSFLTQHPPGPSDVSVIDQKVSVAPSFVFWGRLRSEKNITLALDVFAEVRKLLPHATFDVIGPDRGALEGLKAHVAGLNLGDAVRFVGPLPQEELLGRAPHYQFYLQTSLFEGMAMSVIEAMGMGLVPIVTPVGEIPEYCHDGQNGIHVTTPEETARRIAEVVANPEKWKQMSSHAATQWNGANLFQDDYCDACNALLPSSTKGRGQACAD